MTDKTAEGLALVWKSSTWHWRAGQSMMMEQKQFEALMKELKIKSAWDFVQALKS